jgi:predicted amidohydrolase YtcJ
VSCCRRPASEYLANNGLLTRPAFVAALSAFIAGCGGGGVSTTPVTPGGGIDTILKNGNLLLATPNTPNQPTTAVAISAGKIFAVGSDAQMLELATTKTVIHDLGGATLSPGFIDSHVHLVAAFENAFQIDLSFATASTFQAVITTITRHVGAAHAGDWLYFDNFDPSLLTYTPGVGFPQLGFAQLDPISTSVNIFVGNASGHIAYANSLAFQNAGVTNATPNPPSGTYVRDANGNLTGVMLEPPTYGPFYQFIPPAQIMMGPQSVTAFLQAAQRKGVTMLHDPAMGIAGRGVLVYDTYAAIANDPAQPVGLVASLDLTAVFGSPGGPMPPPVQGVIAPSKPGGAGSYKNMPIPNLKVWTDGSTQGYTAYLTSAYIGTITPPQLPPTGIPDWTLAQLMTLLSEAKSANWSMLLHCNGDQGLNWGLQTIATVYGGSSPSYRNRIEHCTISEPSNFDQMKSLGVTPTFLNNHTYTWGDTFYLNILGAARSNRLDAAADAVSRGMIFSFHSDYGTSNPDPLRFMQTAVTRQTSSGRVLNASLAISALEALKAVTIYPAMQLGIDTTVGTIQAGKNADFTELAQNPLTVGATSIASIPIKATWRAGRRIAI